jgi:hypothetical protein
MKRTNVLLCTCLLLVAGSSFGQDRAKEDSQTEPNAPMNPAPDQQGGMQSNTTHNGTMGSKMTMQQCQDMTAMEKKNPGMNKDAMKDRTCAQMKGKGDMGQKGDTGPSEASHTQSN